VCLHISPTLCTIMITIETFRNSSFLTARINFCEHSSESRESMQSENASPSGSAPISSPRSYTPHQLFNSPDADIVLGSRDGVLFRVHSYTLRTTSGWFKAMFTLPQKEGEIKDTVTVYLDEDAITLEALLRCVCGLPIPRFDSYDVIELVLYAAEKYDMPGPPSIVHAMATTPALLSDPLRLFVLACRYGWDDIIQLSAAKTLSLNLHDAKYLPWLAKLSTLALLRLLAIHRNRRDALQTRMNKPPFISDGGDSTCAHCGTFVEYHTWRELKHKIFTEMDVRPLGDTICDHGLMEWPEARRCWEAKCANCSRVLYDKKETFRVIRECIEQLPTTLE
jgi:hypothetical protein